MTDLRSVFFFDIDNCLYSKNKKVHDHMTKLIDQYFITHLELSQEDAFKLHQDYYKNYGLAIEGLVRHHKIDPIEYNRQVDDAIPLEDILSQDPELRALLLDIDKSKVKMWLFTNAYVTHGKRVVRLLGVDDLFDGMTFCDYAAERIICKPIVEMYERAMKESGAGEWEDCYFVDDSFINCEKAEELGWNTVHLLEDDPAKTAPKPCKQQIHNIQELRNAFPHLFKSTQTSS